MNPTLKQPLKINGSNFGNMSSSIVVMIYRDDGKKNYRLKILNIRDEYMEVGFPGALAGRYRLSIKRIFNNSAVYSRPLNNNGDLLTVGVFVYSVSPQTGSPYGGT